MFTYKLVCGLRAALVSTIFTRNKGTGKVTVTDPIQQLFLDKLREYRSKSPDGSMVDPSPAILKEMTQELEKLDKNYGGGKGIDMSAFPAFKFGEAKLDSINEVAPEEDKKKKTKKKAGKAKKKAGKDKKKAVTKKKK